MCIRQQCDSQHYLLFLQPYFTDWEIGNHKFPNYTQQSQSFENSSYLELLHSSMKSNAFSFLNESSKIPAH